MQCMLVCTIGYCEEVLMRVKGQFRTSPTHIYHRYHVTFSVNSVCVCVCVCPYIDSYTDVDRMVMYMYMYMVHPMIRASFSRQVGTSYDKTCSQCCKQLLYILASYLPAPPMF